MQAAKTIYAQVGVIGIRDPMDRYHIIKTVPIYEEIAAEQEERDLAACADKALARMLAEKFKQYVDGTRAATNSIRRESK